MFSLKGKQGLIRHRLPSTCDFISFYECWHDCLCTLKVSACTAGSFSPWAYLKLGLELVFSHKFLLKFSFSSFSGFAASWYFSLTALFRLNKSFWSQLWELFIILHCLSSGNQAEESWPCFIRSSKICSCFFTAAHHSVFIKRIIILWLVESQNLALTWCFSLPMNKVAADPHTLLHSHR